MTTRNALIVAIVFCGLMFVGLGRVVFIPWGSVVCAAIVVGGLGLLHIGDAIGERTRE